MHAADEPSGKKKISYYWEPRSVYRLIKSVEKFPCLWVPEARTFLNIKEKQTAWDRVAEAVMVDKNVARRKWQRLRYDYRGQLEVYINFNKEPTLIFFNSMAFLKPFMVGHITDKHSLISRSEDSKAEINSDSATLIEAGSPPPKRHQISECSAITDTPNKINSDSATLIEAGTPSSKHFEDSINSGSATLIEAGTPSSKASEDLEAEINSYLATLSEAVTSLSKRHSTIESTVQEVKIGSMIEQDAWCFLGQFIASNGREIQQSHPHLAVEYQLEAYRLVHQLRKKANSEEETLGISSLHF